MTGKNETRILLLSLLATLGLIGLAAWSFKDVIASSIAPKSQQTTSSIDATSSPVEKFLQVQNVPLGTFDYGGSTTWAAIRGTVDLKIQKARPEFRLNYVQQEGVAPSTQSGIELLVQGKIAFSLASRLPSSEVLQELGKQGIQLRLVPIADSFDVVAVNPSTPISSVTIDQINAIRSGSINNWSQIGGPNLLIQQFDRNVNADMIEAQSTANRNLQTLTTPLEVIREVAETPGSFAVVAASLAVPQCSVKVLAIATASGQTVTPYKEPLIASPQCLSQRNQVNLAALASGEYPSELRNTLYVVIKQNGQLEQQIGEAYANFLLSDQGQNLLEKAGYLKIR